MEILLADEFRLFYALLLAAAVFIGPWRFVSRRLNTDWADRAADILLLAFLIQYLAVAIPGLVELLHPLSIALTTLALSAAFYFAPARSAVLVPQPIPQPNAPARPAKAAQPRSSPQKNQRRNIEYQSAVNPDKPARPPIEWTLLAATLFAIAYLLALAWNQHLMPVMANDPITYHFPAAVQWLQTGRLGLYETWFFNPANTYSPLAGSTIIAWWIAPLGNDVLARHIQIPALVLVYFAAIRLMRALGVRTSIAALIALALLVSKPFLRQAEYEKDDLYLTAFFACAAAGFAQERLRDSMGAWRMCVSLGLFLATKYTALLALPVFILAIDAPMRAGWSIRRYIAAISVILLLAGPWYLRNFLLTHNPLYPVRISLFGHTLFPGLFTTQRSTEFAGLAKIWGLLTDRAQSLPLAPMLSLLVAWAVALVINFRGLRRDPLIRHCLLGPPLALAIFLLLSPYPELRFLDPAFMLLFVTGALAIGGVAALRLARAESPRSEALPRSRLAFGIIAAGVLLLLSMLTAFPLDESYRGLIMKLIGTALLGTIVTLPFFLVLREFPSYRRKIIGYGSLALLLLATKQVYTDWSAYVVRTARNSMFLYLNSSYGQPTCDAWEYICTQIPPTEPLAYTNTHFILPMTGFGHDRRVFYIPTRKNIEHLHDLPFLGEKLSDEQIKIALAVAQTSDTDADAWLSRVFKSKATHLVIFDRDVVANPPEKEIVGAHRDEFEQVFQDQVATIYRLKRPSR